MEKNFKICLFVLTEFTKVTFIHSFNSVAGSQPMTDAQTNLAQQHRLHLCIAVHSKTAEHGPEQVQTRPTLVRSRPVENQLSTEPRTNRFKLQYYLINKVYNKFTEDNFGQFKLCKALFPLQPIPMEVSCQVIADAGTENTFDGVFFGLPPLLSQDMKPNINKKPYNLLSIKYVMKYSNH